MRKALVACVAMTALTCSSTAKADVVYVTVTGTVASSSYGSNIDSGGLFGTAGADLFGDAYTAHYTFDTSLGLVVSSPTQNYAIGGSATPYGASPSLAVDFTISGVTVSDAGSYLAQIYGRNDGSFSESSAQAWSSSLHVDNYMKGLPGTSPGSINTSYTIYAVDNPYVAGFFQDGGLSLNLTPSVYTEYDPSVSNIPEPASIAVLGLGLLGLVVTRRRTQSTLAVR